MVTEGKGVASETHEEASQEGLLRQEAVCSQIGAINIFTLQNTMHPLKSSLRGTSDGVGGLTYSEQRVLTFVGRAR